VVLQSGIRSYLVRKECNDQWRKEFDQACANGGIEQSNLGTNMERYISILLRFYNVNQDTGRLMVAAKCVLLNRDAILPKIQDSVEWNYRIRALLSISLNAIKVIPSLPPATFLRLMEVKIDPP